MKRAILSDIHGNLDALLSVLEDIKGQSVDSVYCLGDVVGYGAQPGECIDHVIDMDRCILGNHDQAALFDPEGFSSGAERAIRWTRDHLKNTTDPAAERRWNFLCELDRVIREGDFLFVHGSARSPLTEYVFPEDVFNKQKMEKIFSMIPKYCFQGHTHVPGVFTENGTFLRPDELQTGYRLGEQKVMINVGSVGQPRDGDTRSCYAIVEENQVFFRRVEYPVQSAVDKIHAIVDLDRFLGDRLLEGR